MSREDIISKLENIFEDVLDIEDLSLKENMTANDVEGWDSLVHITILETVQEEYNIKFDLEEIIEIRSVANIVDAVLNKGK